MMGVGELKGMSVPELERLWEERRDELVRIRQVLDAKRGGDERRRFNIDFTEYVRD